MNFPQLRVRTGYSYRDAYGRMKEVTARLKDIGCTNAAAVDFGTWGHVRYEQALTKAELTPMFGMEVPILSLGEDEDESKFKPRAWMLAKDTRKFYNATSDCVQQRGLPASQFGTLEGVVRFSGGAIDLLQRDQYDYVDVSPASLLAARRSVTTARRDGKPLVITSYNDMPDESHKDFAYSWEVRDSVGMRHIATVDELWSALRLVMTRAEFDSGVENAQKIAEELAGIKLAKAPLIHAEGDIVALCRIGQEYRLKAGHIAEWTPEYEARLHTEIEQIKLKDFDSYFLVVADLIRFAKLHMLVGPARGSSAGSLVCYLMGITEVDPLPFNLLFQRFIDISRSDLPDIDIDFADTKRYMVFDYLRDKYGISNVAKLGNINTLQAASVLAQVGKKFDVGVHETSQVKNSLLTYSSADERYGKGLEDTFSNTEPGKEFVARFSEAAKCMSDLELHPSHAGVHAAGIVVCNDAIKDYCTVNEEGVAQVDKPDSEYLNLLKIDALGLRTLGIIEDSGVVTAEELYGLKLDDPAVLAIINEDRVSGIFQFEGQAVRSVANLVDITSFDNIDHITALARPGPLSSGMAVRYIERVAGREEITYVPQQLEKYLSNTYGVFLYQEQIMSVVKELGNFDWVKTSAIRKAMSGRKGPEFFNKMGDDFVAGALTNGISEADAKKMWEEMLTFGAWGFNKSHSVSYAIVTYWTCWMKRYHKLPFAAACLRAAKDDTQTISILRELEKEGVGYTPIDVEHSAMNWTVADGRLIGGIMNAKGFGPVTAARYIEQRDAGTLTDKARAKLANSEIKFASLKEAHAKWGHLYDNPVEAGVTSGSKIMQMKDAGPKDTIICIGKLIKKVLADENEAIRIKKRNGVVKKGQTQFIDLMMVDDSADSPMRFRIRPENYLKYGKVISESAPLGSWFLVKGWKISGLEMFIVNVIKRLDPPKEIDEPA